MKNLINEILEMADDWFDADNKISLQILKKCCQDYLDGNNNVLPLIVERLGQSSHKKAEETRIQISARLPTNDTLQSSSSKLIDFKGKNAPMQNRLRALKSAGNVPFRGMTIEISKLLPHPQVENVFPIKDEILTSLQAMFSESGYLETLPIIVVADSNNQYLVVAGITRFNAAKLAGLEMVPVILTEFSSADVMMDFVFEDQCLRRSNSPDVLIPAIEHFMVREAELANKRQGKRSDLTSESNDADVVGRANDFIARRIGISAATVSRYKQVIRTTDICSKVMAGKTNLSRALKLINDENTTAVEPSVHVVCYRVPEAFLHFLIEQCQDNPGFKSMVSSCPAKTKTFIAEFLGDVSLNDGKPLKENCL